MKEKPYESYTIISDLDGTIIPHGGCVSAGRRGSSSSPVPILQTCAHSSRKQRCSHGGLLASLLLGGELPRVRRQGRLEGLDARREVRKLPEFAGTRIIALGDYLNDRELLEAADIGIASGNALKNSRPLPISPGCRAEEDLIVWLLAHFADITAPHLRIRDNKNPLPANRCGWK